MMLIIILLLLNIILIICERYWRSPFIVYALATMMVFTLPHAYYSFYEDKYSNNTYYFVSLSGIFYLIAFIFFRFFSRLLLLNNQSFFLLEKDLRLQWGASISFFIIALIILGSIVDFSFFRLFNLTWVALRESGGRTLLLASFFIYIGASVLLISWRREDKISIFIVFFLMLLVLLLTKSRSYLVVLFVPIGGYFLIQPKIKLRTVMFLIVGVILAYFLYSVTRQIRHSGSFAQFITNYEGIVIDIGELKLLHTLYYFVDSNILISDSFATLKRLFFMPFRVIGLIDNSMLSTELSHILWDQKRKLLNVNGSLHATSIGDAILSNRSFGWLVHSCLYAMTFSVLEKITLNRPRVNFLFFGVMCLFALYIARGAIYNGYIILIVSFLMLSTLSVIFKFKIRRQL